MHSDSSERGRPRARLHIGRACRAVVIAVVGLGLMVTLAIGVTSTAWFRRALERRVVANLEKLTGGRLEIRSMDFNPLILQVTLRGVVLHGSEPPSEPPLFRAEKVVARLSLVPLARRKLRLRALDWENATIHVTTNPDDSTNFPSPRPGVEPKAIDEFVALSIGRLSLARTQIEWNQRRLPLEIEAHGIAILLRENGARRYTGNFASSGTQIRSSAWSMPPVRLTSQFELRSGLLNVKSLAWQSSEFSGQCAFSIRTGAQHESSFSFETKGDLPLLSLVLRRPELRAGHLNLQGEGSYRQGEMTARGRVQGRAVVFQSSDFSPGPADFSADYVANRHHIEVSNLVMMAVGGEARGGLSVSLRPAAAEFVLRAQVQRLDLYAVARSLPRAREVLSRIPHGAQIQGVVAATWGGAPSGFRSQFDLHFQPLPDRAAGDIPVSGHARGEFRAPRPRLELREVKIQTPHSTLSAGGKLATKQSNLGFELMTSDFEEWRALTEFYYGLPRPIRLTLESPAKLSGSIAGSPDRSEIHARLEAASFRYGGRKWDGLTASILLARDLVQISSGRLRHGTSALTLHGSAHLENWRLAPHSSMSLSAQAQNTPFEVASLGLGPDRPLSGLATGRLELTGTAAELNGAGDLVVEQGQFAREPFDRLSTRIRVTGSVWSLEDVQLVKGRGRLSGELRFDPSREYFSAEFHGKDFSLADFGHLPLPRSPSTAFSWLGGRANFDVRGNGVPEDLRLHSTWSISDFRVNGDPIGDLRGQLDCQANEMRLRGESEGPGGLIRFSGQGRGEANWPFTVQAEYQNVHVEPWIRVLLNRSLKAAVVASGDLTVSGPLKDPRRWSAQNRTQDLEVRFPSLTWKNEHPVDLWYAREVLTASRFRMRGPSTDFEVDGSIHFGEPGTLSVNAQGEAEATLLSLINPDFQATGRSELKLAVTANLSSQDPVQPLINGTLQVRDVNLRVAELPFPIAGLNGEIRLEGERATAKSLRAMCAGGSVVLSGFTTLRETPRFDIRAALDHVRVPYSSDFSPVVNGSLHLVGSGERSQLGGELIIRQVFVSENFHLMARLIEGGLWTEKRPSAVSSTLASKIRLNVQLNSGAPLRLETREWMLLADIDLSLQGTLASPVTVGTIHCRSGEAFFRGNRYKLARGELRMANPLRTQPMLDLEASTRVQRYELTVDISGPVDRLKLAYRSDPPLPTEDVLSLLALGFSQRQGEASTAAGRPLPTLQAGALLSQALSSQVTGRIQRLFGISRIKVDPNVGGAGNASGARVTFEQQVTRDLTFTYVTNTATSQYRIIQFEWAVSENTSVVGVRDQNGIFGLEVKFRRRFR